MRCRRKFNLRMAKPPADQDPDNVFIATPVPLIANSAGLHNLSCNTGATIPVRLLAIEESVPCAVSKCEYNSPNYNGEECRFEHNQFAHLYLGTEIRDASIQHYIIAFVKGTKIEEYNELTDILYDTVKWLNIKDQRPCFFIYYHGKQPTVGIDLDGARNNMLRRLRARLGAYEKDDKSFCRTFPGRSDALNFTISDSNPYQFNMS